MHLGQFTAWFRPSEYEMTQEKKLHMLLKRQRAVELLICILKLLKALHVTESFCHFEMSYLKA